FADFLDEATRTGQFDQWIRNSVRSMQSLGKTVRGTVGILAGLTRAFESVGGYGMHEMADGLERISGWVNSSGTQAKLENIFTSAMQGAANAGRGFADLSKALWTYEADFSRAMIVTGGLAGDFMTQISRINPS